MRNWFLICFFLFVGHSQSTEAQINAPTSIAYDYSTMYERINPSIAKVFTDTGHGSGFLIDDSGLIATNHHVVGNSRYLAVQFADGLKYQAVIAVMDPQHDIAILKVNKEVITNIAPLPLGSTEVVNAVKAGIPVVAFGSPLSQSFLVTQGIVSKVEDTVLVGDYVIEPGNSGGPLLSLDGQVIGINTFGNRGISGAVRIELLREQLTTARSLVVSEPKADPLPSEPEEKYSTELLKQKVLLPPIDDDSYEADGGDFDITVITPVAVARRQIGSDLQRAYNRASRRGDGLNDDELFTVDGLFYDWQRKVDSRWLDNLVTFEVKPDFGSTSGSTWAMVATAALSGFVGGYTGIPQYWVPPHQNIEFKAEFFDLHLYRDGVFIEPITPGRMVTEQSFSNWDMTFIDEAYSGMYSYPVDVFLKGDRYTLQVYEAQEPDRPHKTINLDANSEVIRQIRRDFVPN